MKPQECAMCELAQLLGTRRSEIRTELRIMNPVTDPNYDRPYHVLVNVDADYGAAEGTRGRLVMTNQADKRWAKLTALACPECGNQVFVIDLPVNPFVWCCSCPSTPQLERTAT